MIADVVRWVLIGFVVSAFVSLAIGALITESQRESTPRPSRPRRTVVARAPRCHRHRQAVKR